MPKISFLLFFIVGTTCSINFAQDTYTYQQELSTFKNSAYYKMIFDEEGHSALQSIQRCIENYSHVTFSQRLIRFMFFNLKPIIVTPENMPKLYAYVQEVCQKANIPLPIMFISRIKGLFNAFAVKLFVSTGGIILGEDIINKLSDGAVEGVIAHEIAHIAHNHLNKNLVVRLVSYIAVLAAQKHYPALPQIGTAILPFLLPKIIIGKKFEQEADEFAYKTMGKGKGLMQIFQYLKAKELSQEYSFKEAYAILKASRNKIALWEYAYLHSLYYFARTGDTINKGFHWLYYHTFLGEHPSPEARIEAIEKYLKQNNYAACG